MRKFMVMMIKLVILILVALHANNLAITHSHPSKLDIVQITFMNCLVLKFEYCHEFYREHLFSLIDCAYRKLEDCKYEHELSFDHPLVNVAIGCIKSCVNKSRLKPFRLEACFITCYEEHMKHHGMQEEQTKNHGEYAKQHWDFYYMQNPELALNLDLVNWSWTLSP